MRKEHGLLIRVTFTFETIVFLKALYRYNLIEFLQATYMDWVQEMTICAWWGSEHTVKRGKRVQQPEPKKKKRKWKDMLENGNKIRKKMDKINELKTIV